MSQVQLAQRIGFSTLFMQSDSHGLLEALDLGYEAGFRTVEIVPTTIQGHTGYPTTRFCAGIDLDDATTGQIDALAASIERFPVRNVHSMSRDINIASRNQGIARESVRQFLQCAQLAADIAAQSVTFHIGLPNLGEQIGDEQFVIDCNVEFGKQVAEFADNHDLKAGYENLGGFPNTSQMQEIIARVDSPRFGCHLDVGHAWLVEDTDPVRWVEQLGAHLVAVHMHGTYHRPDRGFANHQSLELDDCTDLPALLAALDAHEFHGPMILELLAKDIPTYLQMCQRSRDILLEVAEVSSKQL